MKNVSIVSLCSFVISLSLQAMEVKKFPLHDAVSVDAVEQVKLLLSGQVYDANQLNSDGLSALHLAADRGLRAMAELLLDNGANIDQPDASGWTPLHYTAGSECNAKIAVRASQPGASWTSKDGHLEVAQLLIARGARVGQTVLALAKRSGSNELLQLFKNVLARQASQVLLGAYHPRTGANSSARTLLFPMVCEICHLLQHSDY